MVLGLAGWVHGSPRMRYDLPLGADSLMLSLKMLFDGNRAEGITAEIALHIGDESFAIRVASGELAIARGEIDNPDAVIDTDTATLLSIVRAEQSVDDAHSSGRLRLTGNQPAVENFARLFPLPTDVSVPD